MKAFVAAVIAAIILGIGAMLALTSSQRFAYQAFATSGARVSEPGTNLVGPRWDGDPAPDEYDAEPHGKVRGAASEPKRS
ncbi:hypothetical protein [Methylobacterium gnaphalii]|uniref:Uncharacterized protein n=1 Tax=Methylobacterium gnaphalii TaxID=1010610 RepID=A0A512JQF2_9HYPH|nr:hypothetical protein [Methylobacterium gnaphalii]GEP12172.1 hypothetical protein MGN01_40170 [Methylobacterium gnaphalii]GJD67488.1 hypothetical protein MMMDOFMJ_0403 [Methylobacterium gnaphalii]GLS51294.1 hypothetical protein GCM10007885_41490 [Methylobacterium gnaphalii]